MSLSRAPTRTLWGGGRQSRAESRRVSFSGDVGQTRRSRAESMASTFADVQYQVVKYFRRAGRAATRRDLTSDDNPYPQAGGEPPQRGARHGASIEDNSLVTGRV